MFNSEEGTRIPSGSVIPPKREEFSFFYKFDDIKCYVANNGVAHTAAEMPVVHTWELFELSKDEN